MQPITEAHAPAPVLRLRDVEALTGRKRSSIYEDMAAGRMPRSIKIGPRAVGWLRTDIEAWQAKCVAERDQQLKSALALCQALGS